MADQVPQSTGIIPSFLVEEVEPLRSFYIDKLGFEPSMGMVGKDGKLDFAMVSMRGLSVMIGRPPKAGVKGVKPETERAVEIYCYVADVDGYYEYLNKKRVPIVKPIATEWWGDRLFSLKDPYGYTLYFCQTVAQPNPPPGVTVV